MENSHWAEACMTGHGLHKIFAGPYKISIQRDGNGNIMEHKLPSVRDKACQPFLVVLYTGRLTVFFQLVSWNRTSQCGRHNLWQCAIPICLRGSQTTTHFCRISSFSWDIRIRESGIDWTESALHCALSTFKLQTGSNGLLLTWGHSKMICEKIFTILTIHHQCILPYSMISLSYHNEYKGDIQVGGVNSL